MESQITLGNQNLAKVQDSLSTNHLWQRAFSKGDQDLVNKKKEVSVENDFMHQCEQVEMKLDAIEVIIFKIC